MGIIGTLIHTREIKGTTWFILVVHHHVGEDFAANGEGFNYVSAMNSIPHSN